jgi:hypothetical protein
MEYNNMEGKPPVEGPGVLNGACMQSRYASRGFIGLALGPTHGLLDTLTDVTSRVLNEDVGDRVLHNFHPLLLGNNLFWIVLLINQVTLGMH